MNSVQFRALSENRNMANRIFGMPEFQAMYGALVMDRPSKLLVAGLPMHTNASHAMYSKGYEDCLEKLLLLGIDPAEHREIPMTFEDND